MVLVLDLVPRLTLFNCHSNTYLKWGCKGQLVSGICYLIPEFCHSNIRARTRGKAHV